MDDLAAVKRALGTRGTPGTKGPWEAGSGLKLSQVEPLTSWRGCYLSFITEYSICRKEVSEVFSTALIFLRAYEWKIHQILTRVNRVTGALSSCGWYMTAQALGHGEPAIEHMAIYLLFFIPGWHCLTFFFSICSSLPLFEHWNKWTQLYKLLR